VWRERYDLHKRYDFDFSLWTGPKAVISLENKHLRSYALEPAGSFFSDAGHCFQMVSNDYFCVFCFFL